AGLPQTLTVKTGRGVHFYLEHADALRTQTGVIDHVDLRADGSYVVAPPSVHVTGCAYQFEDRETPIAALPTTLVSQLKAVAGFTFDAGGFAEGERNTRLTSIAGTFARQGITGGQLDNCLLSVNANVCDPPLDHAEVMRIGRSVERYAEEPYISRTKS